MVLKKYLSALVFLLVAACGTGGKNNSEITGLPTHDNEVPSNWKRISADGKFSFSVPPNMVELDVQGIDSYVGQYRNGRMDLGFDYGWYSGSAEKPDELIDGKNAQIITRNELNEIDGIRYTVFAEVHFQDIGLGETNLTMWLAGKSKAEKDIAKIIFRSITVDADPSSEQND